MKAIQKNLWCTLIESCCGYWSVNLQNFLGSFYNEIMTVFLVNLMINASPEIIYNSVFNVLFIMFKMQLYQVNKQHCQISGGSNPNHRINAQEKTVNFYGSWAKHPIYSSEEQFWKCDKKYLLKNPEREWLRSIGFGCVPSNCLSNNLFLRKELE